MGIQEQTGKGLGGKQNSFLDLDLKKIPVSSILIVSNEEMRPIFYYYCFVFNVLWIFVLQVQTKLFFSDDFTFLVF